MGIFGRECGIYRTKFEFFGENRRRNLFFVLKKQKFCFIVMVCRIFDELNYISVDF
jgi:hypothetical protein